MLVTRLEDGGHLTAMTQLRPLWKSDAEATSFPELGSSIDVAVAVIGGGITGTPPPTC